jgi:hypothetical protein
VTEDVNLRPRRCGCSDCVRIRPDFLGAFHKDQRDTPDRANAVGESRDWSSADRGPADMPIRSRIWGADR